MRYLSLGREKCFCTLHITMLLWLDAKKANLKMGGKCCQYVIYYLAQVLIKYNYTFSVSLLGQGQEKRSSKLYKLERPFAL